MNTTAFYFEIRGWISYCIMIFFVYSLETITIVYDTNISINSKSFLPSSLFIIFSVKSMYYDTTYMKSLK